MRDPGQRVIHTLGLVKAMTPDERAYVRRWVCYWVTADSGLWSRSESTVTPRVGGGPIDDSAALGSRAGEVALDKAQGSAAGDPERRLSRTSYKPETPAKQARPHAHLDPRDYRPAVIRKLLPPANYDDK
jgi:hypothetical protein